MLIFWHEKQTRHSDHHRKHSRALWGYRQFTHDVLLQDDPHSLRCLGAYPGGDRDVSHHLRVSELLQLIFHGSSGHSNAPFFFLVL